MKGIDTGIGIQQFLEDLGMRVELRVHTDSAAAQGICKRVGLGTQRHVAVNSLWVQEKLRRREFSLYKVKGEDNPADLFTKHLPSNTMKRHLHFMGAEFREGRPKTAPMRKDHEHIIGEEIEWQLAEAARNKLDDAEVEMRLMDERSRNEECHGGEAGCGEWNGGSGQWQAEECMSFGEYNGGSRQQHCGEWNGGSGQ